MGYGILLLLVANCFHRQTGTWCGMGRSQRQKGVRGEREFAKLIGGHRVPLSGAQEGYPGDVIGLGMTWEVKRRADGFKQLYGWLENADAVALRSDGREWLVCLPLEKFLEVMGRGENLP